MDHKEEVTQLLMQLAGGQQAVLDQVLPVVYADLRRIAHRQLRKERADHTLNTTALVHEAYFELLKLNKIKWKNRTHFFSVAAQAMRHILVDYAVRRKAEKRGGGRQKADLDVQRVRAEERDDLLLALDEALNQLEALDKRQAQIVSLRFFTGLSIKETAEVLKISEATVNRDWVMARAWLNRELG